MTEWEGLYRVACCGDCTGSTHRLDQTMTLTRQVRMRAGCPKTVIKKADLLSVCCNRYDARKKTHPSFAPLFSNSLKIISSAVSSSSASLPVPDL
jgi:hypothetical protein